MHEAIVEHIDEIEEEWNRPIGERMLKIAVLAVATFAANILFEMAYDKIRNRYESTRVIEVIEIEE